MLHRCGAGFADVIAADRNRIPARHFARCEFHHVSEKTQRGLDREDRFVLCLDFLENVGLNCAAQLRNNLGPEPPFRRSDVHGHDDRRWAADRHRRGEIWRAKIESIVQPHHVFNRIDRHTAFADLSKNTVRVAVDAIKRRAVERGAEAVCALVACEIVETFIRVFRQH